MFQVHEMDRDTYVLRMSKCANFEAPFLYLLIGKQRALLLDSGAQPAAGMSEVRAVVDRILAGRAVELVVAHSHGHGDHRAGDDLFRDRPRTTVVDMKPADVHAFFGLDSTSEATFDLTGRPLRVLAISGHEPAHIAIYDARHRLLLTGDTLYPGMLTIRDWPAFRASIRRLHAFAQANPVDWILGAHVEMTSRPGEMYPLETLYQPEEHMLPLSAQHLTEMAGAIDGIGEAARRDVHDAFILEPVAPAPDRPTVHGMLLVGDASLFASHLPLFHSPHDYQVILEVKLPEKVRQAYAADRRATGENIYALAPERFVLPDQVQARKAFKADLYRGHFERDGTVLAAGVLVEIVRVTHFRKLEPGRAGQARDEGLLFGRGSEAFLAHRITAPPDFDQVAAVDLSGGAPAEAMAVCLGSEPLAEGQRLGLTVAGSTQLATVRRVFYTEFGDLEKPGAVPPPDPGPPAGSRKNGPAVPTGGWVGGCSCPSRPTPARRIASVGRPSLTPATPQPVPGNR